LIRQKNKTRIDQYLYERYHCLGKWVWCLQIDFQCLNDDGNLFDSCLFALNVALRDTMIPTIEIELDTQKPLVYTKQLIPLKYNKEQEPLCCTIAIYEHGQDYQYLIDPTLEEETIVKSLVHYVLLKNDQICLIHKTSGAPCSMERFQQCYSLAHEYIVELRRKLNQ
jgi:exosome complex RNA-binding protein Rrp42 (RNase PH superfamily)